MDDVDGKSSSFSERKDSFCARARLTNSVNKGRSDIAIEMVLAFLPVSSELCRQAETGNFELPTHFPV